MVGVQEVDVDGPVAETRKRLLRCPLDLQGKGRKHPGQGWTFLEGALGPPLPTLEVATTYLQEGLSLTRPSVSALKKINCRGRLQKPVAQVWHRTSWLRAIGSLRPLTRQLHLPFTKLEFK